MDQAFDLNTLHVLRRAVLAEAAAASMPGDRAIDVMLAVHELAANSVRHGGGAGRVRIHVADGELRCQVSDGGPGNADADTARLWSVRPGHGLWLVRNAADHVSMASGFGGSQVTLVFTLLRLTLVIRPASDGRGPASRRVSARDPFG